MAAKCYWCETNNAPESVANPVGTRSEPIGCCKNCQVLVCGHHAIRDPNRQEFKCYDCLFIKLIASAVHHARLNYGDRQILIDMDVIFTFIKQEKDFYENFNEFKIGNEWFSEIDKKTISYNSFPTDVYQVFKKFSGDAEKFLIAAAYLISKVEVKLELEEITPKHVLKYYLIESIKE